MHFTVIVIQYCRTFTSPPKYVTGSPTNIRTGSPTNIRTRIMIYDVLPIYYIFKFLVLCSFYLPIPAMCTHHLVCIIIYVCLHNVYIYFLVCGKIRCLLIHVFQNEPIVLTWSDAEAVYLSTEMTVDCGDFHGNVLVDGKARTVDEFSVRSYTFEIDLYLTEGKSLLIVSYRRCEQTRVHTRRAWTQAHVFLLHFDTCSVN